MYIKRMPMEKCLQPSTNLLELSLAQIGHSVRNRMFSCKCNKIGAGDLSVDARGQARKRDGGIYA